MDNTGVNSTFGKFQSKKFVLTKKINNVIYELLVKTHSDMVYVSDTKTLTEVLDDIFELLTTSKENATDIKDAYDNIFEGAPETFRSFKEVWDYVNINGDPKSELIKLLENKQEKEDGKGLSTNDFTNLLYEKLTKGYSKEELDKKFTIISSSQGLLTKRLDELEKRTAFIPMSEDKVNSGEIEAGNIWFQIVQNDINTEENKEETN